MQLLVLLFPPSCLAELPDIMNKYLLIAGVCLAFLVNLLLQLIFQGDSPLHYAGHPGLQGEEGGGGGGE